VKRFTFSLETLLRVRRQREELARRDFALALGERTRQEAVLSGIDEEAARARTGLSELVTGRFRLQKVLLYYRYLSGLKLERERGEEKLAELTRVTEEEREKLVQASREKKVVELLREKHYKRYLREADRLEQRELDDVVSSRAARRAMGYEV
jgi:flagellar FliJ protein